MKQFLVLFFNKTFLIYLALHIASHIIYPYLYIKASRKLQKRLSITVNSKVRDSYQTIEILSTCFFFVYCFIPEKYIMPNYIMILLLGGYVGFRLAIRVNQYMGKEKNKNG